MRAVGGSLIDHRPMSRSPPPGHDGLEDGDARGARRLEEPCSVLGRALDELGAAELELGVRKRVLEVDDEDGGTLARLHAGLAVAARDPRIVGRELERHRPSRCQFTLLGFHLVEKPDRSRVVSGDPHLGHGGESAELCMSSSYRSSHCSQR